MTKEYSYEEFTKLPENIQRWAQIIAQKDGRPAHREDYVDYAIRLVNKTESLKAQKRFFEMAVALENHKECHCFLFHTFLDWFDYVLRSKLVGF
jgi:hypothetical protein